MKNSFFKYAFLELKNSPKFSLLFVLIFSLGLMGLISVDSFKHSINKAVNARSRTLLGADISLSARRPISEDEFQKAKDSSVILSDSTRITQVYSMLANQSGETRLVQIKAIESKFPFYGEIRVSPRLQKGSLEGSSQIWVYPELLTQLKMKVGDSVKVGKKEFVVSAKVLDDSASGFDTSLAPRVYMSLSQLEGTGLMQAGSMARYRLLFKAQSEGISALEDIRDQMILSLGTNDIRVRTHIDNGERNAAILSRLNDFLGLCALAALFLASIGGTLLFRSYLRSKLRSVATLISIGLDSSRTIAIYVLQIFTLGFLSTLTALLFSILLSPLVIYTTQKLINFDLSLSVEWSTLLKSILVGTLGSLLLSLPVLNSIRKLKPVHLFQEKQNFSVVFSQSSLLLSLPFMLFFYFLSVYSVKSYFIGSLFFGLMILLSGVLFCVYFLVSYLLGKFGSHKNFVVNWALRDFARLKSNMTISFLSLGIGVLLLNIIPQLESTLSNDLRSPEQSKIPELFLFDIQPGQLASLQSLLKDEGSKLESVSPLVRAKLSKVNGVQQDQQLENKDSVMTSREEEDERRFRSRGFNISYSLQGEEKSQYSRVVKGRELANYDGQSLPGLSLERDFARRMGWKIGDRISFDVQGIEIEGVVENYRQVKWTSFQPNFFVNFAPGVLDHAPKTFLASIPKSSSKIKQILQNQIVESFPNISIIDVSRLTEKLLALMAQMGVALKLMAFLTLLVGFVVIYSISYDFSQKRSWDIALLKSMGLSFEKINQLMMTPFVLIAVLASFFGVFLGFVLSFAISTFVFDTSWSPNLLYPSIIWLMTVLFAFFVTKMSISSSLKKSAKDLLSRA